MSGRRGDSTYFCFNRYNERSPGVGRIASSANVNYIILEPARSGASRSSMGPSEPAGCDGLFVPLGADGAIVLDRDIKSMPDGRRATREIETLDRRHRLRPQR